MYGITKRKVPAVEEAQPVDIELTVVAGVVDLPKEPVDNVFAAVLQLGVFAVCGPPWIGELFPAPCLQGGAFTVAVVPVDDGKVGRQLEPTWVVVVKVRAQQLILERDSPARRESRVGLTARRAARGCHLSRTGGSAAVGWAANVQTAPSSVSVSTPVNDDITTSRSPGNRMAGPVAASSAALGRRQMPGASTRR